MTLPTSATLKQYLLGTTAEVLAAGLWRTVCTTFLHQIIIIGGVLLFGGSFQVHPLLVSTNTPKSMATIRQQIKKTNRSTLKPKQNDKQHIDDTNIGSVYKKFHMTP